MFCFSSLLTEVYSCLNAEKSLVCLFAFLLPLHAHLDLHCPSLLLTFITHLPIAAFLSLSCSYRPVAKWGRRYFQSDMKKKILSGISINTCMSYLGVMPLQCAPYIWRGSYMAETASCLPQECKTCPFPTHVYAIMGGWRGENSAKAWGRRARRD